MAALHLHREYRQRIDTESVLVCAQRMQSPEQKEGTLIPFDKDHSELLLETSSFEFDTLTHGNPGDVASSLKNLLESYQPEVIHFQHFLNIGLDMIRVVRNTCPDAVILMTLYEYLPICRHNGQMVKTHDHSLCSASGVMECTQCFPELGAALFRRRELVIKSYMNLCDGFIASSEFLKQRYIEWGLPADRMTVIDNGFPRKVPVPLRRLQPGEERGRRFAYFGQLTEWKGVDVLLFAYAMLNPEDKEKISLEIHGANLEKQSPAFQAKVRRLLEEYPEVQFRGRYRNEDLPALMAEVDWIVVPSIWWENSPLVIQESRIHGKVVICSDIGGMAEKVRDGINGFTFEVGNVQSLTETLVKASTNSDVWMELYQNQNRGPWVDEIADQTLSYYRQLQSPSHRNQTDIREARTGSGTRPVFILGAARSGTSILMKAMKEGALLPGLNEGHVLPLLMKFLEVTDRYYSKYEEEAISPFMVLSSVPRNRLEDRMKFLFRELQENLHHGGVWVDKTPGADMILLAPVLLEIWPNARFIFAKRRGLENLISRRRKFPDRAFEQECRKWGRV